MARILIVGGGCRGLDLARELHGERHALRIVTRSPARRAEIEAAGAECFIGDPGRLVTLRAALEHVAVVCWLLATASGEPQEIRALHDSRLAQFLVSLIDTTVRGFVYEAGGSALAGELLAGGARTMSATTARNSIPASILSADPRARGEWLAEARDAVRTLLEVR